MWIGFKMAVLYFSPLNNEVHLNSIYKFSCCLTKPLPLHYKGQSVNAQSEIIAVYSETRNTDMRTADKICRFAMLKQMVHIVTAVF
jgi:hypothetical protein